MEDGERLAASSRSLDEARPVHGDASGPLVARLFHRLLAVVFVVAWLSLAVQVHPLIGSRGLLPLAPFIEAVRAQGLSVTDVPTIFLWASSDAALTAGIAAGLALSVAAFVGVAPRLCFALLAVLYLSYATAHRVFLSFQWDNLLIECSVLAALLPRDRPARWAHILFRVLLFKLYWESGIAKWQSALHDWHDGSAMTFYYETAPLPTPLAHLAHALPVGWHHLESRLTLVLELVVPLAIFGPRRARLAACAALTGFQIANAATANYGFFCYLSTALHVFLLGDADIARARDRMWQALRGGRTWLGRHVPLLARATGSGSASGNGSGSASGNGSGSGSGSGNGSGNGSGSRHGGGLERAPRQARLRHALVLLLCVAYIGLSGLEALLRFGGPVQLAEATQDLRAVYAPFRVVNTYHLFAAITRERIEPEVQTSDDGLTWTARDLCFKPGDVMRAPSFVAPHQPRLAFQLWFYGLGHRRPPPAYISGLLNNVCRDPAAIEAFFAEPLPPRPVFTRIVFYRYRFTTPADRSVTGAWWTREWVSSTRVTACAPDG